MPNYVYKITNLINGKIYVGKRKHKNPLTDSYMGSGRAIRAALQKYGTESFKKEILQIFETDSLAAEYEKSIVTDEFVSRSDTYNMHIGGAGGFDHINNVQKDNRVNILSFKKKIASGEITVGGCDNWSEDGRDKVIKQAIKNHKIALEKSKTPEAREKRKATMKREKVNVGSKNSQFGTHVYIDAKYSGTSLPPINELMKCRYKEGFQPEGYILVSEWADSRKNKNNSAYGKKWYNDGVNNYLIRQEDMLPHYTKGRLVAKDSQNLFCKT